MFIILIMILLIIDYTVVWSIYFNDVSTYKETLDQEIQSYKVNDIYHKYYKQYHKLDGNISILKFIYSIRNNEGNLVKVGFYTYLVEHKDNLQDEDIHKDKNVHIDIKIIDVLFNYKISSTIDRMKEDIAHKYNINKVKYELIIPTNSFVILKSEQDWINFLQFIDTTEEWFFNKFDKKDEDANKPIIDFNTVNKSIINSLLLMYSKKQRKDKDLNTLNEVPLDHFNHDLYWERCLFNIYFIMPEIDISKMIHIDMWNLIDNNELEDFSTFIDKISKNVNNFDLDIKYKDHFKNIKSYFFGYDQDKFDNIKHIIQKRLFCEHVKFNKIDNERTI